MESDVVTLQDIFLASAPTEEEAVDAHRLLSPLRATGLKPHFLDKMASNNVALSPSFFTPEEDEVRSAFAVAGYGAAR
jgi:pilus assembly protein CpaF